MHYSKFGEKFASELGINSLMQDLNVGINSADILMLGGGNPARIPEVENEFNSILQSLLASNQLASTVGNYDGPQGRDSFRSAVADYLSKRHGWDIGPDNVALTNGSQNAFFYLFNIFAGEYADGAHGKVLLPLAPEYIGYCDSPLAPDAFTAAQPDIQMLDDGYFKYAINRERIEAICAHENIRALCASRPTNPSGNMLTDSEVRYLYDLARSRDIPLILDYAYGAPFPGIVFCEQQPFYAPGCIACLSLSKLGLPGTRCGIVVAEPEIIELVNSLNGVINLAPGGVGATIGEHLLQSDRLDNLCANTIKPFYGARLEEALQALRAELSPDELLIHKPEGGFFLWLWLPQLRRGDSFALYQKLKQQNLLVVSGHYFFPGLADDWQHSRQCLRINASVGSAAMAQASAILAGALPQFA